MQGKHTSQSLQEGDNWQSILILRVSAHDLPHTFGGQQLPQWYRYWTNLHQANQTKKPKEALYAILSYFRLQFNYVLHHNLKSHKWIQIAIKVPPNLHNKGNSFISLIMMWRCLLCIKLKLSPNTMHKRKVLTTISKQLLVRIQVTWSSLWALTMDRGLIKWMSS